MQLNLLLPVSIGAASALVFTLPADAAQLQSWWFDARENQLVFVTDTGIQPRAQMIFNPTRIVIDLPGTILGQAPTTQAVGGAIREVRSGQFDPQTARLVVELNPGYAMNPGDIQVQGVRSNRWVVKLPPAERTDAPPGHRTANAGNTVEGQFIRGADTYLEAITATPDGFFIRTRGEVPDLAIDRTGESGEERQITITLGNTSISPFLRAASLPVNRYSVRRWAVVQDPRQQTAKVTLTLAPESPNWQISSTNLGGIVLVPPGGVSIRSVPDQNPRVDRTIPVPPTPQPQPGLPPQPQFPAQIPPINTDRILVALDPGHGGRDPGAVGIGGLQEKTIVLPISLKVAEILRAEGVEVVMTRSDDRTLDLEPRVDIANRTDATIFLSIHANAISLSRPDVNGVETYYYTENGRALAQILHANALSASGLRDRGVKQARFYVLRHTAMPAALIEVGFVTGVEDVPRLQEAAWRENMARAIARGILQYLEPYR